MGRRTSLRRSFSSLLAGCALLAPAAAAHADTLYVTDRQANVVHQFNIGATGALTALNPPTVFSSGSGTQGIAVSLDGRSVYTTNTTGGETGGQVGSVSQFGVSASGALATLNPFQALGVTTPDAVGTGVAVTSDGLHAYVSGADGIGGVYGFSLSATGQLTPSGFTAVLSAEDVVAHPTLTKVYIGWGARIRRYDVQTDGRLTDSAETNAAGVHELVFTPNGRFLYATAGVQDVLAFSVDGAGALTPLGSVAIPSGTVATLAASDTSVYVSETGTGVTQYDIGGDGRLTLKTPATVDLPGSPAGIALAPDGRSAYVASYLTSNRSIVAQLDVGAGGVLTPKAAGSLVVGGIPEQLAVTALGTGGGGPPGPPPPPPPAPPAPPVQPPARRLQINEILLYRRAGGRYVGFKWDARGVRTEITCVLTREARDLCDATVEIIDLFADNVRVIHAAASRGRRRARRPTVLARGRIRLAPGRTGTIRLRFTRAGRRAIRGRRALNAVVLTRLTLGSEPPLVGQARAKLTPASVRRAPRRRRR